MSVGTAKALSNGLIGIGFMGRIGIGGNGEPLLNNQVTDIVSALKEGASNACEFEIITNGDLLSEGMVQRLTEAGITKIIVSMHDGAWQEEAFRDMFLAAGVSSYILRKHWDPKPMILSSRCGAVHGMYQSGRGGKCYMPFYDMNVSPSGSVGLCDQDWDRIVTVGNVNTDGLMDTWTSELLNEYRVELSLGSRGLCPCNRCDADGTLYGKKSFDVLIKELSGCHLL